MGVLASRHLFVVCDGTLFAQPIDQATMQPRGDPVRVADNVGFTLGTIGYSPLSAAGATVAYGPSVRLLTALQWRDRSGTPVGPVIARGVYRSPRLSNDGRQVVLTVLDEQANSPDIWIFELARGTFARVTSDPATDWFPVWAQDGDRVFFGSARTDVDMPEPNAPYPNDYAASADGKRFLVNTLVDQPSGPSLAVVLNWGKPGR